MDYALEYDRMVEQSNRQQDELRRLAEVNAEMLLDVECFLLDYRNGLGPDPERLTNTIAKAKEQQ